MWETVIVDTRRFGAMAEFMDGFVHIVPRRAFNDHWVQMDCWCDPRVVWSEEGGTLLVSHKHRKPPKLKMVLG